MDGRPVVVPRETCCGYCARGALGVARGMAAAREHDREDLVAGAWSFAPGERYVTVDALELLAGQLGQSYTPEPREPWQQDPDAWKGGA